MTSPNLINRVVIGAANVAAAPKTTELVSKSANLLVDNKIGRWSAHQVDDLGSKVLESQAAQHAALKAETLVTNVINSVPIVKDLASSLFDKVNSFIAKVKLKSPMIRAYNLGMQVLAMSQNGKSDEEILKHTKSTIHILRDDTHTPASKVPALQEIENRLEQSGVTLRTADNGEFAQIAEKAIKKLQDKGIELPSEIRLSKLFPNDDRGYINPEVLPPSKSAIFLNARADWSKAAKMSQMGKKFQSQSTSSPEHPIYHLIGRTMYNGAAGSQPLVKSNAMPEKERLIAQGISSAIETPEDFMGEMFAHLVEGTEVKKELTPLYKIYSDWGGQIPENIDIKEGKNTLPTIMQAKPLEDLDITI